VEIPVEQFKAAMAASHDYIASTAKHLEESHLTANYSDSEHMTFGCKVTTSGSNYVDIDGSTVGTYTGHSFYYWPGGNNAGTWSCDGHRAYNNNGRDLGYAATWSHAALLIYKQN
jgi:hypothetical protein